MSVEDLDKIQQTIPGCEVIAFADISTRMVLITNSDLKMDRVQLDALCSEADLLLSKSPTFGGTPQMSVRRTSAQTVVFVRNLEDPNDVLIGLGAPSFSIEKFALEAQQYFIASA